MSSAPIIDVTDLKKSFGNITAVDGITFSVEPGEIFAFLGPNGAGKSTTIKMLTTLLSPTSGKVRVNRFDPTVQQDSARHSFGIVFQDQSLDDELTAWENLEFHGVLYGVDKGLRRARIEELLQFVGLADRKNDLVKNFSGGMKRRLEITRGLIHHPAILFLDEPTLGLDPQTRNHIWQHLRELNEKEGMTVFFTTHYMEEAEQYATRIAIIDHGKIVALGSPNELKVRTNTASFEAAFLALTGSEIRPESADPNARMRMHRGRR